MAGSAVVWVVGILVFVAVIAVGIYVATRTPVVQADTQGDAQFDTPASGRPSLHFALHCHGDSEPTYEVANSQETRSVRVSYEKLNSENCQSSGGQECKKQTWEVTVDHDWVQDLDPKRETQHDQGRFQVACPCMCPSKILDLKWKDFERRPYPNGEHATYYNVRFQLTDPANHKEVATWTAWVRIPGGHTHYGDEGFKQIQIDPARCSTPDKVIGCAQQQLGQELASPPGDS
jgi:hypothetical protein